MYLSSIPVETGHDPTRRWPGKLWVSNPYRVHQRLCMAFDGSGSDLHRFVRERFSPPPPPVGARHEPRSRRGDGVGVLFRIEGPIRTHCGLRPRILVQSCAEPDWEAAFYNAPFLIVREDLSVKPYEPQYAEGEVLRFRLRANPTIKRKVEGRKNGARVGLQTADQQRDWLGRKAEAAGFELVAPSLSIRQGGFQHARRSKMIDPNAHIHRAVLFEGLLRVTSEEKFREAIVSGIGSAKAYGFGLLSVAPA